MKRLNNGDVFSYKLLNDQYLFGKIIFLPNRNTYKLLINPKCYLAGWFKGSYLLNIYNQISMDKELKTKDLSYEGIFVSSSEFSDNKERIEIIGNEQINPKEVEFPETVGANREDGYFLQRGELILPIKDITPDIERKISEEKVVNSFTDICSFGDAILFYQNRKSEMQREYFAGWKHTPSDLRFHSELKNKIYNLIGEAPNQNYYELALKYGYDLTRLY